VAINKKKPVLFVCRRKACKYESALELRGLLPRGERNRGEDGNSDFKGVMVGGATQSSVVLSKIWLLLYRR
jgi:hypothetical protein